MATVEITWHHVDHELPPDSKIKLLAILCNGEHHVIEGAYDHHWTGRCWVFANPRTPPHVQVLMWADPVPFPHDELFAHRAAGGGSS